MELSGPDRPYEYLYWQAQASGKLCKTTPSSKEVQLLGANHGREPLAEAELRGYLDYWSHASDLWNYIGYNYVFTVFNFIKYPPQHFFEARRNSEDLTAELPPIPERFTFPSKACRLFGHCLSFPWRRVREAS
jgi:hypothetical protein